MAEPFIGEIKMFAGNFAPKGWAFCNGQVLPLAQNQALFAILGTTYGGNGVNNFALPNLQASVPIHFGQGAGLPPFVLGQTGGEESHTLTSNEIPNHTHTVNAVSDPGNINVPTNALWATSVARVSQYGPTTDTTMSSAALGPGGSSLPHENRQPYLTVNFIIALVGIFPSRN
jgi:microcystin-dependent protein